MERKTKLKVDYENNQEKIELTYKTKILVRNAIEATLDYEGYENYAEVSVTFVDNEGIQKLNKQYRKIDKPTDVLSFPLLDFEGDQEEPPVDELFGMLGDIVISLEQAKKQAEEYGHSFEREVAFLTVHSMLHLLGYDHVNGGEEEQDMRNRQTAIVDGMGYKVNK